MSQTELFYAGIMLVSVFVASVSQVMLKKSAERPRESRIQEYLNPLVIAAYILFVGCTLVTVIAYRGIPLSLGPVLEATRYVYVTAFGVWIFKEKLDRRKLVALALILGGIFIYAFFG